MTLDVHVEGALAVITLNRPDVMNAIDPEMRADLRTAWQSIEDDDEIRAAIITGAGDRAFSTGSDLKRTMTPAGSAPAAELRGPDQHLLAGLPVQTPVICAINGYAVGGGLELALGCDIRIASDNAQFGLPEVRIGSIPGGAGTQLLPHTVGRSAAMHMALTGDRIDADKALSIGLISEITTPSGLMPRARELGERIAANAPLAVSAVKRLVAGALDVPLQAGMQAERYAFGLLRDSEDRLEGRRAFVEKRPPVYRGR